MPRYEYKVVPAPRKGEKAKGVKGPDGKIAQAMEAALNKLGAQGWEYQRTDAMPVEERSGLAGRITNYHTVLVFRRELAPEGRADYGSVLTRLDDEVEEDPANEDDAPDEEPAAEQTPERADDEAAPKPRPSLKAER